MYIGPKFPIAQHYAVMVAICMVIHTYVLSMPVLYIAGFLCFFNMFWIFKLLFFRYYRNPPMYTS